MSDENKKEVHPRELGLVWDRDQERWVGKEDRIERPAGFGNWKQSIFWSLMTSIGKIFQQGIAAGLSKGGNNGGGESVGLLGSFLQLIVWPFLLFCKFIIKFWFQAVILTLLYDAILVYPSSYFLLSLKTTPIFNFIGISWNPFLEVFVLYRAGGVGFLIGFFSLLNLWQILLQMFLFSNFSLVFAVGGFLGIVGSMINGTLLLNFKESITPAEKAILLNDNFWLYNPVKLSVYILAVFALIYVARRFNWFNEFATKQIFGFDHKKHFGMVSKSRFSSRNLGMFNFFKFNKSIPFSSKHHFNKEGNLFGNVWPLYENTEEHIVKSRETFIRWNAVFLVIALIVSYATGGFDRVKQKNFLTLNKEQFLVNLVSECSGNAISTYRRELGANRVIYVPITTKSLKYEFGDNVASTYTITEETSNASVANYMRLIGKKIYLFDFYMSQQSIIQGNFEKRACGIVLFTTLKSLEDKDCSINKISEVLDSKDLSIYRTMELKESPLEIMRLNFLLKNNEFKNLMIRGCSKSLDKWNKISEVQYVR